MSDFKSITSFVKCDHLKIGGQAWPHQYSIDNAYLKFSNINGLEWEQSSAAINNFDSGLNDYIVMNNRKGGSGINLTSNTSSYIRAVPGERLDVSLG